MPRHCDSFVKYIKQYLGSPILGAEVGVFEGENAENLLDAFPLLNLLLVDPYVTYPKDHAMQKSRFSRISQEGLDKIKSEATARLDRFGWRANWRYVHDYTLKTESADWTGKYPFVIIDADHSYEGTAKSAKFWRKVLKPGGLMFFHDYNGVRDRRGDWGVKRAVDEFAQRWKKKVQVVPGRVAMIHWE